MPMIDEKTLEKLKAEHGEIYVLTAEHAEVQVACQRPTRPVYRKFRSARSDPSKKDGAFEALFLACLVFPSAKDFEATLDRMPALADTFGVALWDKTIGAEDASVKKL